MTAEERIRSVLRPGEMLLWWDVPVRRRFYAEMAAHVVLGLIPFAMGGLCVGIAASGLFFGAPRGDRFGFLFMETVGLFFVGIGVHYMLYPLMMHSRLREVVYAVTDQRGIILSSPSRHWNPVPAYIDGETLTEFSPNHLRACKKKWRDFGRTDLVLHQEWRRASRGNRLCTFGFLGLEDPDKAEKVIRGVFPEKVAPAQSAYA